MVKPLDSGRLDRRIEILKKGETLSALGETDTQTHTPVAQVWAELMAVSASEKFASGGDQAFHLSKFRIRYRADLDEDMVVDYDGWLYDIAGIEPAGQRGREWLILTAHRNTKK